MRTITLLALLLLSNSLFAQQATEASTRYAMTGLVNPEQLGNLFLVDATSDPVLQPVGIIKVNPEAKNVSVSAFRVVNGEWDLIAARELKPLVFAIEKSGNWMVAVRGEGVTGEPFFNLVVGKVTQPPPCLPPPTGDFAKLEARSRQLVTALNDPETAKALSATLEAATKLPGLDLDAARTVVISRIASTLLARSPESRRTKNWEGGWRKPIEIEILALHTAGRLPDTAAYFAAIKSLAESLK